MGLSLARAYVSAAHELLRSVAIRYIGSCGESSDAQLVSDALEADSELVRMVALTALGALDADGHSETLFAFAGAPLFSVRSMVVPGLLRLSQEKIDQLRARAEGSGNYWQRKTLAEITSIDEDSRTNAGVPWLGAPFLEYDIELGARLGCRGSGPWEWGLPGLCRGHQRFLPKYVDFLSSEDEVAEAFDRWMISGEAPWHLLPLLRDMAVHDEDECEPAVALAMDMVLPALEMEVLEPAAEYYGLEVAGSDTEELCKLVVAAFVAVDETRAEPMLSSPNPSAASFWPRVFTQPDEPRWKGIQFIMALIEQVKFALHERWGQSTSASELSDDEFRHRIEEEWQRLLPLQDWFYGFAVYPDVLLNELGRYCNDRASSKRYRTQIGSYLSYMSYMATAAPCSADVRREARKATRIAYASRFEAAAGKIVAREKGFVDYSTAIDHLHAALEGALDRFDIYWAAPYPDWPLGALAMAWRKPPENDAKRWTALPTRHLPFAHMIERLVRAVIRDLTNRSTYISASSLSESELSDDSGDASGSDSIL